MTLTRRAVDNLLPLADMRPTFRDDALRMIGGLPGHPVTRAIRNGALRFDPLDWKDGHAALPRFLEIVHSRGRRGKASKSFAIGFRESTPEAGLLDFEATFESRDAAPAPTTASWRAGAISAEYRLSHGESARIVFESPDGVWEHHVPDRHRPFAERWGVGAPSRLQVAEPTPDPSEYIGGLRALPKGSRRKPSVEDLTAFSLLYRLFVLRRARTDNEPDNNHTCSTTPLLHQQRRSADYIAYPSGRRLAKLGQPRDCSGLACRGREPMKPEESTDRRPMDPARDPGLTGGEAAMRRAAKRVRCRAAENRTPVALGEHGRRVRVTADRDSLVRGGSGSWNEKWGGRRHDAG